MIQAPMARVDTPVGSQLLLRGDTEQYVVRAVSSTGRWVICTRPPTAAEIAEHGDVSCMYSVIDWDEGVRGPDNYGGLGYEDADQIAAAMARFESGDAEISARYHVPLEVVAVTPPSSLETGEAR